MVPSVPIRLFFMSKSDIVMLAHNFEAWSAEGESFRLYQCGRLNDMRNWQHNGLGGPFWRFYHHSRSGSAIRLSRRLIPLHAEEIVLIPENVRFDGRGAAGVSHFWIHFSPPLRITFAPRVLRLPIHQAQAGLLKEWRELMPASSDARPHRRLVHTCLAVLHACFAQAPLPAPPTLSLALQRVLEEIERSLATPPDNRTLARWAGRSVEGFIRWFHMETGMTPSRYVTGRRIRQACRLLSLTDYSIEEIAEAVGFANRHHFTRVFTRYASLSPAKFRREQRKVS